MLRCRPARSYATAKLQRPPVVVRRSALYIPIEQSVPAQAQTASHKLMLQAGLIRQTAAGVYSLLPTALRSLEKLTSIVDNEMKAIGGEKLLMPSLLPSALWKQSGRWATAGEELIKLKDRKGEEYCLAPTHEEVITNLVAHSVKSFRALPLKLYQIGPKFRDELRPRFGLIRGREFVMKDMYSFDLTKEDAYRAYDAVLASYRRILDALHVNYVVAEADAGKIGGSKTHEFHAITDVGEDIVLQCPACGYTANVEKAKGVLHAHAAAAVAPEGLSSTLAAAKSLDALVQALIADTRLGLQAFAVVSTAQKSGEKGAEKGGDEKGGAGVLRGLVLLRADSALNELELKGHFEEGATVREFTSTTRLPPPAATGPTLLLLDDALSFLQLAPALRSWATQPLSMIEGHFRAAKAGDGCARCPPGSGNTLLAKKGIELGHVFYLGTKYSDPMKATVLQEGKWRSIEMGCYGLGMTRIISALVETSHDEKGIVWPSLVAPYKAVVLAFPGTKEDDEAARALRAAQEDISQTVSGVAGFAGDVVLDDREDLQPGAKMREAELVGYPWMFIVGRRYASEGTVEVEERRGGRKLFLRKEELPAYLAEAAQRL